MRIQFTLTLADYQAAQERAWRRTLSRRLLNFSVYWGFPAFCSAIVTVIGRNSGIFLTEFSAGFVFIVGFLLGLSVLFLKSKLLPSAQFKGRFERKYPPHERNALFQIDESGISASLGSDTERFEWPSIIGIAQDERITLLYIAKNRFLFFPTTAMGSEERIELERLVAEHVFAGSATC